MKPELCSAPFRLSNLLAYFGWQGGTIHEVERLTGVDANTLLYGMPDKDDMRRIDGDWIAGSAALSTCSKDFRVSRLAPRRAGNANYWLGVACGTGICKE